LFVRFFEAIKERGGVYPLTPQESSTKGTQMARNGVYFWWILPLHTVPSKIQKREKAHLDKKNTLWFT
jgi:hypothetical protein